MPRRATSTSYGQKSGNPQGRGPAKGTGGRPTDIFRLRMQYLAQQAAKAKRLETLLSDENEDHYAFLAAFREVADRGFGKAPQAIDVTSDGEKINGLLVLPAES